MRGPARPLLLILALLITLPLCAQSLYPLPKIAYIGTAAWFFMVVIWFKFPFHVFVWHTISINTMLFDLVTLPVILLGAFLGIVIIKKVSEKIFRWFIIVMTLVAAMGMIF